MKIKQSVINTFNRVKIPYEVLQALPGTVRVSNRFSGETVETTKFIAYLIRWVYNTSNAYEVGISTVRVDDFDRVRYFILEADRDAYMTCID